MIAPNMGTMLCFLTTNADLARGKLQKALKDAVVDSFNMLVVDDISTNDTVLLLSDSSKKCSYSDFKKLLDYMLLEFVEMISEDAEGASKSIKVTVKGAKDDTAARKAAKAVVSSNLVKTAVYGENPNWGRIANKLGENMRVDVGRLDIAFKSKTKTEQVIKSGKARNIKKAAAVLKSKKIHIIVDLHLGSAQATAWGCDLTQGYIRINARYN